MMETRDYQETCINNIIKDYLSGIHQLLVVQATGTGKTVVFSKLLRRLWELPGMPLSGKVLIFAHREELVDQAVETVREWNPEYKVGKEMANDYADDDCDVVVSCVASIGRNGATRLNRFGDFSVVICDEAHHSIAQTYLNVFEATGVLKPGTTKLLIGFTATPKRKNLTRKQIKEVTTLDDGELVSLKSVYRKIAYVYPIRKAIKDGWLVPLKGFRIKTSTDISKLKTEDGDYQASELQKTVDTPERNQEIVKAWLDQMEGRQSVAFTAGVQHAKNLAAAFVAAGIKAEAIWGEDPERDAKLERHENKETTVLCNAQLLIEGYDSWRVSCIILAAPTRNPSVYTQEIGRGTRLQKGTGNLLAAIATGLALEKTDCYILDAVDNSKNNSPVTLPSLLGLNPNMELHGRDVVEVTEEIEALQDKYPGISFAELTDISKVKAYVESIDIFAVPFTEEVKEFSTMKWMATKDGEYVLPIPEKRDLSDKKAFARYLHEKLQLRQNELEEWVLYLSSTTGERELGIFNDLQEAFRTADDVIQRCRLDRVKLMLRESPSGKYPATEAAKKYLRRLSKKRPIFLCLCEQEGPKGQTCTTCSKPKGITAGEASYAISRLQHA